MTAYMKKHKILAAAVGVTLALLVILGTVYFVKVRHYETHFFPGTVMSGVDVSELTAQEANQKVASFVSDYLLTLRARGDHTCTILGPDIDYSYVPNGEIEQILKQQNAYAWLTQRRTTKEQEIVLDTDYDSGRLAEAVAALGCMQTDAMVAPADASIQWVDDGYRLIPEEPGTTLVYDEVLAAVTRAVTDGERELELEPYYVNPQVYADDSRLNACMDRIEAYYGTSITYTFGKQDPFELDNETIQTWLDVSADYELTVDDEKVTDFVQQMASAYNTYGDSRKFRTSLGDKLSVSGGDYGWVIDKEKEKQQIYKDLEQGGHIEREPVYSQTAKKHGANDIGNTYVEIDYTNQHLWYYKKGELVVDTDIVSGNIGRNNGSPDGVFKIVYKQRNATLVGEGYSSPVNYFMPFAYNVGIHDASWRSKFGDQIYLTSGSHGCINVPSEVAEILYETLATDTPVVTYYRDQVYLTSENARISNARSYISEEDYKKLRKKDPTAVNPKPSR